VARAAALEVVVHAPALAQPAAGPLRGSFEGRTTIAVGLRARVPFRVFSMPDTRNQIMRVVLDVAQ
jgi:hypothetical protein